MLPPFWLGELVSAFVTKSSEDNEILALELCCTNVCSSFNFVFRVLMTTIRSDGSRVFKMGSHRGMGNQREMGSHRGMGHQRGMGSHRGMENQRGMGSHREWENLDAWYC